MSAPEFWFIGNQVHVLLEGAAEVPYSFKLYLLRNFITSNKPILSGKFLAKFIYYLQKESVNPSL